jgi:Ca-activated chloride channel family protein
MKTTPELTAYALGELSDEEKKILMDKLLAEGFSEEEIAEEVANIKQVANIISDEYVKDEWLRLSGDKRESLLPKEPFFTWKKIMAGMGLSFAGLVAFMMINQQGFEQYGQVRDQVSKLEETKEKQVGIGQKTTAKVKKKMAPAKMRRTGTPQLAKGKAMPSNMAMESKADMEEGIAFAPSAPIGGVMPGRREIMPQEKASREGYEKIDVNPYTLVSNQPLSTFSVDVDTASYANMRRFLFRGQLPPKDSIRVEELINYFGYNYDVSFKKHPVGIKVDQSVSPWNKKRKLVRVALKADSPSDLVNARKNLVFLLDVSGSMNDPKKLPLLKESIKLLVRKLKAEDTVGIVVYAGAAGVVLEGTEAKDKLKIFRALETLSAGGSTNGGAGIIAAYKIAKQNFIKGGVNRVILATDGDFNVGASSQSAMIDMIEEKAKNDIFLTVVGLGMGNYQDAMLEKISNRGNGNYAYIDSLQEANKLFNVDLEKNLTTVAKDVKVQIEFNPNKVQAYRLIGYENRMLKARDFNDDKKDAGEMGAGHTVTALYEIVLPNEKLEQPKVDKLKYQKEGKSTSDSDELLTVKVRYKKPTEDKSTKFDIVLKDGDNKFSSMDNEFRFATAVASFGLKLRNDKLTQDTSYREIRTMAKESKGSDQYGFRAELIEMIDLAKQIDK